MARMIEVCIARPYGEPESVVVEQPKLPRADRTLTYLRRYQLKEMYRIGEREDRGIISRIEKISGRSQIGKVRP